MAPRPQGPAWLYRLYGPDGALLYVGVTRFPTKRIAEHRKAGTGFARLAVGATWTRYADGADAYAAETAAIRQELPLYNFLHSGRNRWEVAAECRRYEAGVG